MSDGATARSRGHLAAVDGFRGVVTAVFAHAVYVAPAHGDLLVVHHLEHGHTPTSLIVDLTRPLAVTPGDPAAGRAGHLRVGDVVIDTRTARTWTPPTPPSAGVAVPSIECPRAPHAALVAHLAATLASPGASAAEVGERLHALVGLGSGLTPAGDDAIVGMLAVLQRCAPHAAAARPLALLAGTLPSLLERTTPISAHYLRLALRGHHTESLVAVVDALAEQAGPSPDALARLLATGATSGADALAGVTAAAQILPTLQHLQDVA
jgi:hypothetical protein